MIIMSYTKLQAYRYSSKVAGLGDNGYARTPASIYYAGYSYGGGPPPDAYIIGLSLTNPIDLISIETLFIHFRVQMATPLAKIIGFNVEASDNQVSLSKKPATFVPAVVSQDGSGIVDFSKAVSSQIIQGKENIIYLYFDRACSFTVQSWKMDMLYTTRGVK